VILKRFNNSKGQTVVIFALVLPILLGIAGLVVDVGNLYVQKAHLQNAVDAAALAGTSKANAYMQLNGEDPSSSNVTDYSVTNPTPIKVRVSMTKEVPTYFIKVLNVFSPQFSSVPVTASAVATFHWGGEAIPLINTGYPYKINPNLVLRTNTSPGDKSQISDFYSRTDGSGEKSYFVQYSDGVTLVQGNGNTKSTIDNITTLNAAMTDLFQNATVGDKYYVLSIKSEIINNFMNNGGSITVTDKNGTLQQRYATTTGGFKEGDIVDPSMLVLLECTFVSIKIANDTELALTYTNEYDIYNGVYPPDYVNTDLGKATLTE